MKNKIAVLAIGLAISFLMMLSFENTYDSNVGKGSENNVMRINYDNILFTPSLSSEPLTERESLDDKDYNYINVVELGVEADDLLFSSPEHAWQERIYKKIIDLKSYSSYFVTDTAYSMAKDIFRTVIDILDGEIISVAIQHEYDVSNPSYADFTILSQEMLDDFMDTVGIQKMDIMQSEPYYNYFEILEEEYHKAGYTTNELTFRKCVDDENKRVYMFVVEHYSKEFPDKSRNETENIAKISYSKSLLQ